MKKIWIKCYKEWGNAIEGLAKYNIFIPMLQDGSTQEITRKNSAVKLTAMRSFYI